MKSSGDEMVTYNKKVELENDIWLKIVKIEQEHCEKKKKLFDEIAEIWE